MASDKVFKIKATYCSNSNRDQELVRFYEGTLESLINTFKYTLDSIYSDKVARAKERNPWASLTISREPRTVRSLVNWLNKDASFWKRTRYELVK